MSRAETSPSFTVFWVPRRANGLRRYRISLRQLRRLGWLGGLVGLGLVALVAHYLAVCVAAHRHRHVRAENVALRTRLYDVQHEIVELEARLWRMEQVAERLRGLTALHDPARALSMPSAEPSLAAAGVMFTSDEAVDEENARLDSPLGRAMSDEGGPLASLAARADTPEAQLGAVASSYDLRPEALATTPSIPPVAEALVVVPFGPRPDPYTQAMGLHPGVDLAAPLGSPVVATAAGQVVEAGFREGGHGLSVVVDHGGGHSSLYSHLGALTVQVGQRVQRGERLGEIGQSGRARGAQLHYEVRFFDVPEDPEVTFVGD